MKYLGISVGGRTLCCADWNGAIDSFRSKLAIWKARHLSLDDLMTLIKSVLRSIPIYPLSLRLLPVRVRNVLHGIMSRFLLGGHMGPRIGEGFSWLIRHQCLNHVQRVVWGFLIWER